MSMEIGDRIRDARLRRKLTQAQLADKVGVNPTAVVLWENKKNRRGITGNNLRKVAEALGVSVGHLLGDHDLPSLSPRPRMATMTIDSTERTLLELFRSFSKELQLLQLANFVECAKLRKVGEFAGHEAGDGLPVDARTDSQTA